MSTNLQSLHLISKFISTFLLFFSGVFVWC